jgi:hypothetical protein
VQKHLVRRTNLLLGTASNSSLEVTQPVPVLNHTQLLSLNCFVLGDDPKKIFTVKIPKSDDLVKSLSGCTNPLLNFLAVVVERLLPLSSKKIWVPFLVLGPALAMRL